MVSSNRHIVFLINPVSGGKAKNNMEAEINALSKKNGVHFEIQSTEPDGAYTSLREQIQRGGVTDVVICGGDGSISQVVGALRDTNVHFGIIPAGSGNGLARAAGIPLVTSEALQVIFDNHIEPLDGFRINQYFSCMLSGLGFDAHVAHKFAQKKKRGLITYITETVKHFFNASSYRFNIQLKDGPHEVKAYFISIANSNQFGNDVTIAPKARLNDGKLDVVIVNNMNKFRLIWEVLHQIRSGKIQPIEDENQSNGVNYFQTSRLHINNYDLAPLHIDGDPVDTSEHIEVNVIKNAFRLLMPAGQSL